MFWGIKKKKILAKPEVPFKELKSFIGSIDNVHKALLIVSVS